MSEQATTTTASIPTWTLGWRLKRALSWASVGAAEMGDHLGYSKAQISRYLNDKGEPPRDSVLRLWAIRCGVPYEWLAFGIEGDDPDGDDELSRSRCFAPNPQLRGQGQLRIVLPKPTPPTVHIPADTAA